jgi:hypothetical protein
MLHREHLLPLMRVEQPSAPSREGVQRTRCSELELLRHHQRKKVFSASFRFLSLYFGPPCLCCTSSEFLALLRTERLVAGTCTHLCKLSDCQRLFALSLHDLIMLACEHSRQPHQDPILSDLLNCSLIIFRSEYSASAKVHVMIPT